MKKALLNLKKNKFIFFLIALSVVILASTVRFALRTYKVPEWDEQHYMRMSTEFYRLIKYNLSTETLTDMLLVVPFRQPGYPLLILPFLFIFGISKSYFWGIFTNGLLYIFTIFGIYLITRNWLSKSSSFLAALIFAFYGWTLTHLTLTYSETADSAFTVWTMLFLIKSNLFRSKKNSIIFGIFLGAGLLVRWIILVYIIGPLLFVLYQMTVKHLYKNRKVIKNFCLAIAIALVLSFYPYVHNYYWIYHYFYDTRIGGPIWQILPPEVRNPLSVYSLTFYLNSFAQLGIFFFLLIVIGLILAIKKGSKLKPILYTVIVGYLFTSFVIIKGERYIVPVYPYLAILSASVFDKIKDKRIYFFLFFFTIILSITSFLGSMWGKGPMKQSLVSLPVKLPFGQWNKIYLTTYSHTPYIYKISGKEILDFIEKDSKESKVKNPQVLSLFYYHSLDEPLMTYNLYNEEKPLQINNFIGSVFTDPNQGSAYLSGIIQNSDYVLVKSGQRTDNYFWKESYKTLEALIALFDNFNFQNYYQEKDKIWINQDSSQVTIYKKYKSIPQDELERIRMLLVELLKSN